MSENFEKIFSDTLKESKQEYKVFAEKQEKKDKEILETISKIDNYMIKQNFINESNNNNFDKVSDEIKTIKDIVDKIFKDYVGKSNISKLIWIVGSCILVFAAAFGAWATYSTLKSEQLQKEEKEREAYALSIPSPKQEEENKELKDEIRELESNFKPT